MSSIANKHKTIPYRKEIDGLRGIAVLSVILFHAGFEQFKGGFVGVDIFFVISGYLIASIILYEKKNDTFSFWEFYERRARRIFPALFFIILVSLPFAWFWMKPTDLKNFSQSLMSVSTFVSNIFFWRQEGYFTANMELKPLLHTWSLAVEEQYYVLFPIFLSIILRFGKYKVLTLISIIATISLIVSQWGCINKPAATFYLLPTRSWELLIGAILAMYLFTKKQKKIKCNLITEISGFVGVFCILYAILMFDENLPFPGVYALIPTLGTVILILCTTEQAVIGKFLGNKFLVGLGLISYSAYLWHQPIFAFIKLYNIAEVTTYTRCCLILSTIILAYFTWRYVECVFRNKQLVSRQAV
jgi:peptidoglycan/LPS O-acetylase OafA/YrhL